jgi:hypothetical protein
VSDISLTVVRHHGEVVPLGRNVALKLLLEKSTPNQRMGRWHKGLKIAFGARLRAENLDRIERTAASLRVNLIGGRSPQQTTFGS